MNVVPHLFWITSRAAGTTALFAASAGVGIGLLIGARAQVPWRRDLRPLHEVLSLATLAFVAVHALALLGDGWIGFGPADLAVPFLGGYRPLWTGLGIVATYGLALLGLSYYFRDRIGRVRWRRLHRFTALFWVLAVVHTLGAGSDATSAWYLILTGLFVVPAAALLVVRWLPLPSGRRSAGRAPASGPAEPGQALRGGVARPT